MKRLTRWAPASCFRREQVRLGSVLLAGVTLLTLVLVVSGLMLFTPAASAAAPFRPPPRPTATPTAQPTSTPTPRPTAAATPRPTATTAPTAAPKLAATSTVHPGTNTGGTAGAGAGGTQTTASLLLSSLIWGLGAIAVTLLIFAAFIWLSARRAARERQQRPDPAFAPHVQGPSRARLNQLHQQLPARTASSPMPGDDEQEAEATLIAEGDTWQPLSPSQERPGSAPLKPPRWLIESGLLKDSAQERSPEAQQEP